MVWVRGDFKGHLVPRGQAHLQLDQVALSNLDSAVKLKYKGWLHTPVCVLAGLSLCGQVLIWNKGITPNKLDIQTTIASSFN